MTIEQTVEIPADRRVFFEFLAPEDIPAGKAKVEVRVTPVVEKQDTPAHKSPDGVASPHPHSDAIFGILSGMGPITIEQIRDERLAERLAKHLKNAK